MNTLTEKMYNRFLTLSIDKKHVENINEIYTELMQYDRMQKSEHKDNYINFTNGKLNGYLKAIELDCLTTVSIGIFLFDATIGQKLNVVEILNNLGLSKVVEYNF